VCALSSTQEYRQSGGLDTGQHVCCIAVRHLDSQVHPLNTCAK
jgi:hypothetical protein